MKLIYSKNNIQNLIIENQPPKTDETYRLSKFCTFVKINDGYLLWNTFNKKLFLLTNEEYQTLTNAKEYSSDLDEYIINEILIPENFNEYKLADQLDNIYHSFDSKEYINSYVIFTTTACNARCFYCFEKGVKHIAMKASVATDVANYIVKKSAGKKVGITWFGGEPLCNTKAIDIISSILAKNNVEFTSTMISNSYLFNNKNIQKAVNDWKIKTVQVTLDGTEKTYNTTKNYVFNDDNAFNTVINNIKNLLENDIKVSIRLNISDDNYDDLFELINYLYDKFSGYTNLKIYANNLYDLDGKDTVQTMERKQNDFYSITKFLEDKNLLQYDLSRWSSYESGCMINSKHSVVITPLGELGKCEHFSEGDKLFGSIYTDETNKSVLDYWHSSRRIEKCYSCPIYPNCRGITNCPTALQDCRKTVQQMRINNLKKCMIGEYKKYIGENNEH